MLAMILLLLSRLHSIYLSYLPIYVPNLQVKVLQKTKAEENGQKKLKEQKKRRPRERRRQLMENAAKWCAIVLCGENCFSSHNALQVLKFRVGCSGGN